MASARLATILRGRRALLASHVPNAQANLASQRPRDFFLAPLDLLTISIYLLEFDDAIRKPSSFTSGSCVPFRANRSFQRSWIGERQVLEAYCLSDSYLEGDFTIYLPSVYSKRRKRMPQSRTAALATVTYLSKS
jgi:hypothetical protein